MTKQESIYAMNIKKELFASVLELKHALETCQHASMLDRNPYLRTRKAKANAKALEQAVTRCLDGVLQFVALLAKYHCCEQVALRTYFYTYQFLFHFHDGVKKQEYIHQIFIKDIEITSYFYTFIDATMQMLAKLDLA